jgi:hypothetical protein
MLEVDSAVDDRDRHPLPGDVARPGGRRLDMGEAPLLRVERIVGNPFAFAPPVSYVYFSTVQAVGATRRPGCPARAARAARVVTPSAYVPATSRTCSGKGQTCTSYWPAAISPPGDVDHRLGAGQIVLVHDLLAAVIEMQRDVVARRHACRRDGDALLTGCDVERVPQPALLCCERACEDIGGVSACRSRRQQCTCGRDRQKPAENPSLQSNAPLFFRHVPSPDSSARGSNEGRARNGYGVRLGSSRC